MFTPEMFVDANTKVVDAVPPFGLRTAIRAAAVIISRVAEFAKENSEIVTNGVVACYAAAVRQEQPPFAERVGNLDAPVDHDGVKAILDQWSEAVLALAASSTEVRLAYASMLSLELVAACARGSREITIVREIFKLELEQQFGSQVTYTGESLMTYIVRESARLWADLPHAAATDLSPLAFAAVTILSRVTQVSHGGSTHLPYVEEVCVSIDKLSRQYSTTKIGGTLTDRINPDAANAAIDYWRDRAVTFPNIEVAQVLSAFAIEALARVGARLSESDREKLFDQIPAHMLGQAGATLVVIVGDDNVDS